MRKCGQPEVLENGRSVSGRWAEIQTNPRTLLLKQSETTWPFVETTPEPEGEIQYSFDVLMAITSHYFSLSGLARYHS